MLKLVPYISSVHYNLIKHVHDVDHMLYGAIYDELKLTNHSARNYLSMNIL